MTEKEFEERSKCIQVCYCWTIKVALLPSLDMHHTVYSDTYAYLLYILLAFLISKKELSFTGIIGKKQKARILPLPRAMKLYLHAHVLLLVLLVTSCHLQITNAQSSDIPQNGGLERSIVDLKKTQRTKKPYTTKTPYQNYNGPSNLCPCHLNSAEGSTCYDFMNQAVGTCRKRTCTDGFVCTSRGYATHYCFEKSKYITKVVSIGAGQCTTKRELHTFRVPYVDIVTRGDEREQELNYNTLMRDDVGDMEPGVCYQ